MKKRKLLWDLLPAMVLWLMLSVFFWGWIFTFLTDTEPENKLTVFADAAIPDPTALAVRLEQEVLGGQIRMVKAHPFTYAMLSSEGLRRSDVYIVRESHLEEYREWFAPLPEGFAATLPAARLWQPEGVPTGVLIWDAETGGGAAQSYITYSDPALADEDCYLLFGAASLHLTGNPGSVDNTALQLAETLLSLP